MDFIIGKRVKVKLKDNSTIIGTCWFAGYNEILEVWQITVDRTPIFPIEFKNVELI